MDTEEFHRSFQQLQKGVQILVKGAELKCLNLQLETNTISCIFSCATPPNMAVRTMKLLYPIDRYAENLPATLFDRLIGTVLVGFNLIPLDHTSIRKRIEEFMIAGKQEELFPG